VDLRWPLEGLGPKEDDQDHATIIFLRVSPPSFTTFLDERVLRQWSWNTIKAEVGTALLDPRQLFLYLSFLRFEIGLLPCRTNLLDYLSSSAAFDIMCLVELIACEIHGAVIRTHTLCPTTRDPLACTDAIYVQRPIVALPEAIRSINSIRGFNRDIAATNSEIHTIQRAVQEFMPLTLTVSNLRERVSTACESLPQLPSQRKEYQLAQTLIREGLLKMLRSLELVLHEQELLLQNYVPMLEKLRLVLQKLKWKRQRVAMMLRIPVQRVLAAGAGPGRPVACRCKVYKLRKL